MIDNPFDAGPDEALGALLRETLSRDDTALFVARVRRELPAMQVGAWDLLARWTRPGLVAAALVALAGGLWLSQRTTTGTVSSADLFASADQTPPDVLLTLSMEGR
ncbi:MAG TPA: hypothetical protein VFI39_08345 [Gemmatimonadales bacterium]|nr:hypothetical protein [Gemmatimonadales bacterium]